MWDAPTIIATAIGGAGLALALIGLGLQLNGRRAQTARTRTRLRIADQLRKGQGLAAKLGELDRATGPWDAIERDIIAWHNETEAILPPEFRSLFESNAGMTFFKSKHEEY